MLRRSLTTNGLPLGWRFVLALLLAAACCLNTGCMRRRMTIVSNPPGALAYVDNQEIGVTPVSASFTYYETRDVRLVRDGYETVTVSNNFPAPWYQYPPIDFFVENLWPWEIRDERIVEVQMEPQRIVPTQELLDRANALRGGSQQGVVIPAPAPAVGPPGTVPQYQPLTPQTAPQPLPGPIRY